MLVKIFLFLKYLFRDSATQRSVHQNETIDENANHSTVNFFKRNFNKLKKKSTFYISGQNGTALLVHCVI